MLRQRKEGAKGGRNKAAILNLMQQFTYCSFGTQVYGRYTT